VVVSSDEFNRQGVKAVKGIVIRDNSLATSIQDFLFRERNESPTIQQRAMRDIRGVDCRLGIKVERGDRDRNAEGPAAHRRILAV
jgi:hypothetical protein